MFLAEKLRVLVRSGDWSLIDTILDALDCTQAENGTVEGARLGRTIGMHVGFLNTVAPAMRERRSFVSLITRYQAALDASPIAEARGLLAETVMGIAPLKPMVS
jgi:hypothetical protein